MVMAAPSAPAVRTSAVCQPFCALAGGQSQADVACVLHGAASLSGARVNVTARQVAQTADSSTATPRGGSDSTHACVPNATATPPPRVQSLLVQRRPLRVYVFNSSLNCTNERNGKDRYEWLTGRLVPIHMQVLST